MPSLLERARQKIRRAEQAKTEEEKARERVRKAVNKVQLEEAREKLRNISIERKIRDAEARAALAAAKAKLDTSKAKSIRASEEKWRARYARAGAVFGAGTGAAKRTRKVGKTAAKGAKKVTDWLWGEEKPKRKKRRKTSR